jgi:hypothetical protein
VPGGQEDGVREVEAGEDIFWERLGWAPTQLDKTRRDAYCCRE